ncbi:hypothetical protein [Motiliproteus sediminis]|uniref:hypothetical protein n=1 Tax=Motiliproteus sediminis TaxID=1468178 RepID=UPI001AEF6AA5|nr:hypothetical protein [Motiliproteus sediminis]
MLEINPQTRLVRHHSGASARWQLQHRSSSSTYTRREIWCPAERLMSDEQTLAWLSRQPDSTTLLERFRQATNPTCTN